MAGGDSDDEGPIGSLFKFKKLRNSKKKIGSEEKVSIRVENQKVEGEVLSGALEMEDTLASFRKKLKAPKMSKESSDMGKNFVSKQVGEESRADVGLKPDRSLNGISKDRPLGKAKRTISDVARHAGKNRSDNGSKSNRITSQSSIDLLPVVIGKSHSASQSKLTEGSLACGVEGLDQSSDGGIEVSLKAHVGQPGRVSTMKKTEESSKGDGGFDRPSVAISKDSKFSVVRRTRSKRKQKEGITGFNKSLDQHSDGDMDDSLSSLLRKPHIVSSQKKEISQADDGLPQTSEGLPKYHIPVPVRKVRSVSRRQKEETPTLGHGLGQNSDEVSRNSLSVPVRKAHPASFLKDTEKALKTEDGVNQVTNRLSKDSLSVAGRKSHNALTLELTEDCARSNEHSNQTAHGISEDSLSVLFRKSRSVSIRRKSKETLRLDDGLSQLSDRIEKCLPSDTVQKQCSDLIPGLVEEIPRSMDDGISKSSGISEDSMLTIARTSSAVSTAHLSEDTPNLKDDGSDIYSDSLPVDSLTVPVERDSAFPIANPTEGSLVSSDGLSQVSVETQKTIISSLVLGSSGLTPELNRSYDGALEDFLFQQVRESSPTLNQKMPEETHKLENGANQNCDGILEEIKYGLSGSPEHVPKDSFPLVLTTNGDLLDGSSDPVPNFDSTLFSKPADNTSTCDLLPSQFSDGISKDVPAEDLKLCSISSINQMEEALKSDDDKSLKESVFPLVPKLDSTSIPTQIEEIVVSDDMFNQLPGGFSEDFQSVQAQTGSVLMHKEETPDHDDDDGSKQSCDFIVGDSVQAQTGSVLMHKEEIPDHDDDDGSKQSCDFAVGDSVSIPTQKAQSNKYEGESNCQPGGVLVDFPTVAPQNSSFVSDSNHAEANSRSKYGFSHRSDGFLTALPCDVVEKSYFTSTSDHTEENPSSDDGLNCQSDGTFTDLHLNVVQESSFASTSSHKEEFPLAGDVSNIPPTEALADSLNLIHSLPSAFDGKPTEEILETDNSLENVSNDPSPIPASDSCIGEQSTETGAHSLTFARSGICPNDAERAPSPDKKEKNVAVTQRVTRTTKRRRHGDMAYEGDFDWDLENYVVSDGDRPSRAKAKNDLLSNLLAEAEDGGAAAAVTAGLKAHEPGPIEKIKFKEVLKRRGGLQEYLECRNMILHLWSKDVCRILPLSDCGVSNAPSEDEPSRASLIREVYAFLDQSGYINVGIVSEKGRAKSDSMPQLKLSKDKKPKENCGGRVADSEEEVAFILGQVRSSKTVTAAHNDDDDEKPISVLYSKVVGSDKSVLPIKVLDSPILTKPEEFEVARMESELEASSIAPHDKVEDGGLGSMFIPEKIKTSYGEGESDLRSIGPEVSMVDPSGDFQRIIVIGAGPAGLSAARHLQRQGFSVCVLEARDRIGGRVHTDRSSLSVPVDLGASIITGVEADVATERRPDPSSLLCTQLGLELMVLNSDCPLYDIVTRDKVPTDLDEALEAEYNSLLDDMAELVDQNCEHAMKLSLEEGFEFALRRRRMAGCTTVAGDFSNLGTSTDVVSDDRFLDDTCPKEILSPLERRVMDWHFANLEYGCAAMLNMVSLPYWNQDDVYGGFGGAHCMIKGGYSTVVESLGKDLDIRLNHIVSEITYSTRDLRENGNCETRIKVSTENGNEFVGDAVLITVPLGCLKANTIKFSPVLPDWKQSSIQRLGFGVLNKVVIEFPVVFWDDAVDYFGATADKTDHRGQCFMFWNVKKTVGAPVLIALVVGKAAIDGQNLSARDHVDHAMVVLRKLFGEALVPDPVAFVVTNWGQDLFSRGAYSYVAVGASGEDYDILGRPVENCLFFAGEATCKEHPDTVGGAIMSGLREAVRIIDILKNETDYTAEVEAMEAAQRQSDNEINEATEMVKRLAAGELSSVVSKSSLGGEQKVLSKEVLLQDMFLSAKTTAGRLHLVKELLQLPVGTLKSFMGTKEGLSTLNSWILDSMGKDGTQLLRHCVRLLVLVSTDLLAVRLSGIGRTVKEKVCVHTSRDIRAVASQLVSMWIEVFRREKAANGGSKFLRQAATSEPSKIKAKDVSSGKPPARASNDPSESRGNLQLSSSAGSHPPSSANHKKAECKPVKLEIGSEVNYSRSHSVIQDSKVEEDIIMSEEEAAAFAAAEVARAAALAAAEAYASSEAECSTLRELPKIPSFHKFARREQYARDDLDPLRKKWPGGVLGKQDCISEIDSRNCRVRNWSVDFSATCGNLDGSRIMGDNYKQISYSNEIACHLSTREHSGESGAVENRSANPWFQKDSSAIDRWQLHAEGADIDVFDTSIHITDEEDSAKISKEDKSLSENQPRGAEQIKQAVVDYVGSLLMPLYKARKIDKEGYKSILKKSATKVIDQSTEAEKAMTVSEFLEFKRKNKIRAFVDKLIERHMSTNATSKR